MACERIPSREVNPAHHTEPNRPHRDCIQCAATAAASDTVGPPAAYCPAVTRETPSATMLAMYLRRIGITRSVSALNALADEIERAYPNDEATPRLLGVIAVKAAQLAGAN